MSTPRYKIALITDGLYPMVLGGMQKHSYYLVKYLSQRGIGIDLYHPGDATGKSSLSEVLTSEEYSRVKETIVPFPPPGFLPGHYLKESLEYSRRVAEKVFNSEVSYIYAKGFTAWALLQKRKKIKLLPKIGVNFHGLEMFQKKYSLRNKMESLLLKGPVRFNVQEADHVFSYGGKISDLYLQAGARKEQIVEIPSGVERGSLFKPQVNQDGNRKFIFLGRYERRKGIEELTEALRSLLPKYPEIRVDFIGPVPEHLQVKGSGVRYLGEVKEKEKILELLRNSEVLICPSHAEGMPNAILEGMSQGLAVIATDVGAVGLMVNKNTGWLCHNNHPNTLITAMESAISCSPENILAKREAAFEKVGNEFVWEKVAEQTVSFLDSVCLRPTE